MRQECRSGRLCRYVAHVLLDCPRFTASHLRDPALSVQVASMQQPLVILPGTGLVSHGEEHGEERGNTADRYRESWRRAREHRRQVSRVMEKSEGTPLTGVNWVSRGVRCRETVGRRVYTVTGREANPEDVEQLIETGESERIFQRAIMEQGRGQVRPPPSRHLPWSRGAARHATLCCATCSGPSQGIRWQRPRVVVAGPAGAGAVSLLSSFRCSIAPGNVCLFMSGADLSHFCFNSCHTDTS